MRLFSQKPKTRNATAFSSFIRDASSREKKKVYTKVLKVASESQNEVVNKKSVQHA
jgi:hypothetical protein